jgi:hypothetical protein
MTQKDEIAALKKKVEELEAKLSPPKSPPSAEERERATREWQDQMHQMRERRMSLAMPPSVIRDMAVLDDRLVKEIALRDARAPTGPRGAIPSSQQAGGGGSSPSSTPGWVDPAPLGPPPGINYVDAQLIADDVKQRKAKP